MYVTSMVLWCQASQLSSIGSEIKGISLYFHPWFGDIHSFPWASGSYKHEYCRGSPVSNTSVGYRTALTVLMLVTPRGPCSFPHFSSISSACCQALPQFSENTGLVGWWPWDGACRHSAQKSNRLGRAIRLPKWLRRLVRFNGPRNGARGGTFTHARVQQHSYHIINTDRAFLESVQLVSVFIFGGVGWEPGPGRFRILRIFRWTSAHITICIVPVEIFLYCLTTFFLSLFRLVRPRVEFKNGFSRLRRGRKFYHKNEFLWRTRCECFTYRSANQTMVNCLRCQGWVYAFGFVQFLCCLASS